MAEETREKNIPILFYTPNITGYNRLLLMTVICDILNTET